MPDEVVAAARNGARQLGLNVAIDLGRLPERRFRVNNGTPRPVTVDEDFLENYFDPLVRFLTQTLTQTAVSRTCYIETYHNSAIDNIMPI